MYKSKINLPWVRCIRGMRVGVMVARLQSWCGISVGGNEMDEWLDAALEVHPSLRLLPAAWVFPLTHALPANGTNVCSCFKCTSSQFNLLDFASASNSMPRNDKRWDLSLECRTSSEKWIDAMILEAIHCLSKAGKCQTSVTCGAALWVSSIVCCATFAHSVTFLENVWIPLSTDTCVRMMLLFWKLEFWLNRCVWLYCVYCWHKDAELLKEWGQHAAPFASLFFFKCTIQFWVKSDDSEAVVQYYCIWQHWLWLSLTSSSVSSLQQLSAFWKMMPQLAAIQSKVPLYPADRIQNCKQAVILGPQMFTEHRIPDLAK